MIQRVIDRSLSSTFTVEYQEREKEREIYSSRPFGWRRWSRYPVSSARVPWTDELQRFTGNSPFFVFFTRKRDRRNLSKRVRPTICSAIFSFIKPSIFELTGRVRHPIRLFLSAIMSDNFQSALIDFPSVPSPPEILSSMSKINSIRPAVDGTRLVNLLIESRFFFSTLPSRIFRKTCVPFTIDFQ